MIYAIASGTFLFDTYAIASGSTQPYADCNPNTLSLHAFLTQPLQPMDAQRSWSVSTVLR